MKWYHKYGIERAIFSIKFIFHLIEFLVLQRIHFSEFLKNLAKSNIAPRTLI